MSKSRKINPKAFTRQEKKALGQIKKVGEINFLQMPDGKIAIPMILSPDIKLGAIISGLDDIQRRMTEAYEVLGESATGSDYVKHQKTKDSQKPS